jgi:NAD(P)-dependent dehydrogenase (short-subunit alcohol dehydrogenase family)
MRLEGKTAVITGAASGMGLAMAKLFSSEGANVVMGDWNTKRLEEAVLEIKGKGGKVTGLQGNIADKKTAESLIDEAIKTYGKIDILVNNAGIMDYIQGVGELSDEMWEKVLGINLYGPMYTSRKAVQFMEKMAEGQL